MINWNQIVEHPPEPGTTYLVSDGTHIDIATYHDHSSDPTEPDAKWYLPDISPILEEEILYISEINAPIKSNHCKERVNG